MLACPYCGTPTPEWHADHPAPRTTLWRRLALASLLVVILGLLLPPDAGVAADVMVLAGSLVLVLYALRVVRGPS